ncbi:MAG TPA: 4Fe-4S binding protein [Candidatus Angelobacter sp.]|nr:4Fe-4S binding protein [Candidatus Angelobacter sp.]
MTPGQNHGASTAAPQITAFASAPRKPRKKLIRRTSRDYSQLLRRTFQMLFLAWNVYLGFVFYHWVRQFEGAASTAVISRPPGVEGWLPIAGMMNFKYWVTTGSVPVIHPAGMFLLVTFVSISFLFRKAFCSWLCPIGTLSEYLWKGGQKLVRRNLSLPRWLDIPLRGLKYLLLGFFVWAVASMSAAAIAEFMHTPYGIIADVKMLNFFRHIGETGLVILGVLVGRSVLVKNLWCRYLCPYGALLGLTSMFSPARIRRNPTACIDCAKCAKVCPAALPVDRLISIKSAECTACMECVAICPAKDALDVALPRVLPKQGRIPAWALATGIAVLLFGIFGLAKSSGHWQTNLPDSVYRQLVPQADRASHPMPGDMER